MVATGPPPRSGYHRLPRKGKPMNAEALKKLGKAALRLAQALNWNPQASTPENPVLEPATVKEDTPKVRVPFPVARSEGVGAPTAIKEPRWILTVATGSGPRLLYLTLYRIARHIAKSRHYARGTGEVAFHLPIELVANHLGVDRTTIWRWAKVLKAKGLIAYRTHYGTLDGQTRATGTIWVVRLRPGTARIRREYLEHTWRNLEADRAVGATAWAWVQSKLRPSFEVLVLWALGDRRGPQGPAPGGAGAPVDLYRVYDLPTAPKGELPSLITHLADHLAGLLKDPGSRRYYAGILWRVARGEIRPQTLIDAVHRTIADLKEGWARRPGALLNHRLAALA